MNVKKLLPGIYKVRNSLAGTFNLSVVNSNGWMGVAAFKDGTHPPRKGKHLLVTPSVRQWVEEMECVESPSV